jgi:hypothetical protein
VDIIALAAVLLWCVRFRSLQLPRVRSVAKARAHP